MAEFFVSQIELRILHLCFVWDKKIAHENFHVENTLEDKINKLPSFSPRHCHWNYVDRTFNIKKLLQTTVYIPIKSPALFAEMVMLMSKHTVSETKDSAKVRLRSDQIIISVYCRFKFNNILPHTYIR